MSLLLLSEDHFSLKKTVDVQNICKPIFSKLSLNYFHYARLYESGVEALLISSPEWCKCFFDNRLPTMLPKPLLDIRADNIVTLWETHNNPQVMKAFNQYGFYHPISFLAIKNGYTEDICFASKENSLKTMETYLNNMTILEKFCNYFREVADNLIQQAHEKENTLFIFEDQLSLTLNDFVKTPEIADQTESLAVRTGNDIMFITRKQKVCLDLLSKGMTAKEIAFNMNISPRTVESHIESIKLKFNVRYKSDLIKVWNYSI